MNATKLTKILASTTLAVAALASTPLAQAGTQKHPDRHPEIISVLRHPDVIGVLRHPDRHPQILGVLKHPDFRLTMRKAGGN
jgi:hypothetical protein